jgi:hypothetical protein
VIKPAAGEYTEDNEIEASESSEPIRSAGSNASIHQYESLEHREKWAMHSQPFQYHGHCTLTIAGFD